MTTGNFVPDPNPGRTSWVFLTLQTPDEDGQTSEVSPITEWQIGVGNTEHLVDIFDHTDYEPQEGPVTSLGKELAKHQDEDNLLITPSEEEIKSVRSNLFQHHRERERVDGRQVVNPVPRPTLHGYRHLPLAETMTEHFIHTEKLSLGEGPNRSQENPSIHTMWTTARSMIPLLPIGGVHHERL